MTRLFDAKPYVIAEVGSNWRTLDDCLESIQVAKACGADAVKFQAFTYEALYGVPCPTTRADDFGGVYYCDKHCDEPVCQSKLKLDWDPPWLPKLRAKADEVGIEFGCTAFSPELVAAVDPYVHWHKVASSDAAWPQMLDAVARTGKAVLISFGGKTGAEVATSVGLLNSRMGAMRVVPLYCVAAYPADYVDLPPFGKESWFFKGFSDHTLGYTATVEAARRGAVVIEKHFTAFPDLDTPDCSHSLTPPQFARMMSIIRGDEVPSEEGAMYLRHNRRLIATQDITTGVVLRYGENFGAYRALEDDTRGASPFDWEKVEGRMAKGPIGRGKGIGLGDVE